eukprot:COSAG05_NODE_172_length_14980_cov_10.662791_11_plen_93_part_00
MINIYIILYKKIYKGFAWIYIISCISKQIPLNIICSLRVFHMVDMPARHLSRIVKMTHSDPHKEPVPRQYAPVLAGPGTGTWPQADRGGPMG